MIKNKYKTVVVIGIIIAIVFYFEITSSEVKVFALKGGNGMNEVRSIFISYLEYQSLLKGKEENEMKKEINSMIENVKENGFNEIILQVRSFSDAIYPSLLFPSSSTIVSIEGDPLPFDILEYFLTICHNEGMTLQAWVNPYRIRSSTDGSSISVKNPCYKWLGSNNVSIVSNVGIFYNPASSDARRLVVAGVEEILENYPVDGILFDDYFYPSDDIDFKNYDDYLKEGGLLTHRDYRLEQVNELVRSVYSVVKRYGKVFGISPEGNMDNNYNMQYADIKKWVTSEGYIDYIMPQLYYGFNHENKPFYKTLQEWNNIITLNNVSLIPALAVYKVGIKDNYALSGEEEWLYSKNILTRQIIASRAVSHYRGFALFRYEYLFGDKYQNDSLKKEKDSLYHLLTK